MQADFVMLFRIHPASTTAMFRRLMENREMLKATDFETNLSSCCAYQTDNFYPHVIGLCIYGKECTVVVGCTTSNHKVISLRSPKASWGTKALRESR